MKKIKIIAFVMALAMLAMCVVSCSSEKVRINCKVSVVVDGETYLDGYDYTVEGKADNPPTVLQAVSEVFTIIEYPFEIDEAGNSFTSITVDGTEYRAGMAADKSGIGFWEYTADGATPEGGRAGTNAILEGQHIVFSYEFEPMNEAEWSEEE